MRINIINRLYHVYVMLKRMPPNTRSKVIIEFP